MLGTAAALGGTAFLVVAPPAWMAAQLELAEADASAVLLRRFAASATAGLAVTGVGALRGVDAGPAALAGLAAWFGGQALAALAGLATRTVGGVARFSAVFDPAMAAALGLAAHRARQDQHTHRTG